MAWLACALLVLAAQESVEADPPPAEGAEAVILKRGERTPALFMEFTRASPDKTTPTLVLFHQARSSKGEYRPIVPRLRELGYNCLAVDLRSGGSSREVKNRTALNAAQGGRVPTYLDALDDVRDALEWARKERAHGRLLAWGSSYSAGLVLHLAGERADLIDGVIAFSPGEYFTTLGKSATWVQESAALVACPTFLTSSRKEADGWRAIFEALPAKSKIAFVPSAAGKHGSSALWPECADRAEYWAALEAFLKANFPCMPPSTKSSTEDD